MIGGCLAFWNDIFGGRTGGRSSLSGGADGWKDCWTSRVAVHTKHIFSGRTVISALT